MSTDEIRNFTSANKAAWEASAHLHAAGKSWDELLSSAKLPGFSILDPHLTEVLQRLKPDGKRAVQIGCNNARELLSLASLGMKPELGIDQSANFLMQARQLAQATGLSPRFVEADVYDLPNDLGTFDLALITIGVLNWMPELPRFFQIVSQLLTDKGVLVIYETHPFLELFDPVSDTPFAPAFSYFDHRPQEVRESIVYDGKDHGEGET